MMPEEFLYVIPACICTVVIVLLMLMFRHDLTRFLKVFLCSLVAHSMAAVEMIKDYFHRNRNTVQIVPWPEGVAVVTGARGIGFEVIKKLLQSEMTVIIGCRDVTIGEKTVFSIRESGVNKGTAWVYRLDLTSLSSIRTFAGKVLQDHKYLHLLVNNAGVSLSNYSLTEDGTETTFATNYLGHCYLTHLLLPSMAATATATGCQSRVVNVASCSHRFPFLGKVNFEDINGSKGYEEYTAYSQSKLCQVLFTITLDEKLKESHLPVAVYSVHPGLVFTNILQTSILHKLGKWLLRILLRSPEEGARAVYYACISADLKERSGSYIYSCRVTSFGKSAQSNETQARLWRVTADMLGIKNFGNMTTNC